MSSRVLLRLPNITALVGQSVITVYDVIRERQPVSSGDITAITGLARGTVNTAIQRLRSLDILVERPNVRHDMRQTLISLKTREAVM